MGNSYISFPRNRKPDLNQVLFDDVTAFLFTAEAIVKRRQAELESEPKGSLNSQQIKAIRKELEGFRNRGETLLAAIGKLSEAERKPFEKAHMTEGLTGLKATIDVMAASQALVISPPPAAVQAAADAASAKPSATEPAEEQIAPSTES